MNLNIVSSFLKDFIYLFMRNRERQRRRQREKQAPCKEPDVGLDPGTPGSHPEPKAEAQPLSHPGIPLTPFLRSASWLHSPVGWGQDDHGRP